MHHRFTLTAAMLAHLAFIGFLVLGGFGAWWWSWLIWPHVAAALWGAWVMGCSRTCPLTVAENWARAGAGVPLLPESGFVAYYLDGRLYPVAWARRMQLLAFTAVLVSWVGLALQ